MTEQYTAEELSKVLFDTARAKAILANQNALAHNEVLKRTPAWKGKIKEHGNPLILELIRQEKKEFNKIEKAERELEEFKGQNPINEAFARSGKIINLLARMAFVDYDLLEEVLYATALDPHCIHGIAKKINKAKNK